MSTNPLEAMLLAGAGGERFPTNSRYHGVATATTVLSDGRPVRYLRRRFAPQPAGMAILRTYRVVEGDRVDVLADRLLGDPETYWRLCDANGVMQPDELTEIVGREIRVALPEGMQGAPRG